MKSFILISLGIAFTQLCYSQQTNIEVSRKKANLENTVKQTEIIIEGYVISSNGFKTKTGIYTSDSVRITKIFKGVFSDSTIEVVLEGGDVDGEQVSISDGDFGIENAGIYFLKTNTSGITYRKDMHSYNTPYSGGNTIAYDNQRYQPHISWGPLIHFDDLEKDVFQVIEATTGQKRKVLGLNIFEIETMKKK